jgi:hypothetical protein
VSDVQALCVTFGPRFTTELYSTALLHTILTSLSTLVSGLYMLHHNFNLHFPCYIPLTKPSLRYPYSSSYNGIRHPVVYVSSFVGHQHNICLLFTWGKEIAAFSDTMCSQDILEYRKMNKVQEASSSNCYTPSSELITKKKIGSSHLFIVNV